MISLQTNWFMVHSSIKVCTHMWITTLLNLLLFLLYSRNYYDINWIDNTLIWIKLSFFKYKYQALDGSKYLLGSFRWRSLLVQMHRDFKGHIVQLFNSNVLTIIEYWFQRILYFASFLLSFYSNIFRYIGLRVLITRT